MFHFNTETSVITPLFAANKEEEEKTHNTKLQNQILCPVNNYRAMLAQSAVMRLHVVCLSVCPSVCP